VIQTPAPTNAPEPWPARDKRAKAD